MVVASCSHRFPEAPTAANCVEMMMASRKASGGEITAVDRSEARMNSATTMQATTKATPVNQPRLPVVIISMEATSVVTTARMTNPVQVVMNPRDFLDSAW